MRVAIFDFDGTLYEEETFRVLMSHLKNHPVYHTRYNKFYRWMLPRYIGYKMKVYPAERMKERSMQSYLKAIDDMSKDELTTFFEEATEKMKRKFNPLVVEKLNEHIKDGVHVMIVSGAYTPLLHAALDELHFDDIIGSEIPFKEQLVDKEKEIYHINGTRKNDKIHEALAEKEIDWSNSYAYADSLSDLSVLELVGNPVAVQPESSLKAIAEERGWDII